MIAANNKHLADRVWEEIWHQGNLERIDELFATDFVRHDPGGREIHGPEQNRQFIKSLRAAFPDLRFTVLDQVAEADKVAVRYCFHGTHLGDFQGMAATRKQVAYSGILIYRIADNKISEQWTEIDLLGLLRQLGMQASAMKVE
jgi:steroid delta-isomerase-like uncharacterized protein